MALVKCGECGHEISEAAAACPNCGAPRSPQKRRDVTSTVARWLVIIFVIVPVGIAIFRSVSDDQTSEGAARPSAAVSESEGHECHVSDIGLDKLAEHTNEYAVTVTGRILNNCSMPVGVQLKITLYDKTGAVLAVSDPWPASTNNIPAKTAFAFEALFLETKGMAKYDVRVVRVNSWEH